MDFAITKDPENGLRAEFESVDHRAAASADYRRGNRPLFAAMQIGGSAALHPVIARILSPKRLMTQGCSSAIIGRTVRVLLRNVGWADGTIARVEADTCEVAVARWPQDPTEAISNSRAGAPV
ncbi:MAG: hypothetical protein JF593_13725 [Novosphingobium sp.]|nr:hypothetical protein [Novosphingobium sp.]